MCGSQWVNEGELRCRQLEMVMAFNSQGFVGLHQHLIPQSVSCHDVERLHCKSELSLQHC